MPSMNKARHYCLHCIYCLQRHCAKGVAATLMAVLFVCPQLLQAEAGANATVTETSADTPLGHALLRGYQDFSWGVSFNDVEQALQGRGKITAQENKSYSTHISKTLTQANTQHDSITFGFADDRFVAVTISKIVPVAAADDVQMMTADLTARFKRLATDLEKHGINIKSKLTRYQNTSRRRSPSSTRIALGIHITLDVEHAAMVQQAKRAAQLRYDELMDKTMRDLLE